MSERDRPGKNRTRQRDEITRVIREAAGPLTVDEILERAQREVPGLGLVTVYRTVKLLREAGQVRTVILPTGESRYEPAERGHHHHFHCRRCDEVFDLAGCPVQIPADREISPGFRVDSHDLTFYGTCPECSAA
jgi:Fur family transcriptional regulator, ferric uptake regulator